MRAKSIHNAIYKDLIMRLTEARIDAELTQQVIADRLGKPQSFVAKVEGLERRIDIVEFFEMSKAIGFDPLPLLEEIWERVESKAENVGKHVGTDAPRWHWNFLATDNIRWCQYSLDLPL